MVLYDGTTVNNDKVSTNERIFLLITYDDDQVVCNLNIAYQLVKAGKCKSIKHLWDGQFKAFTKKNILNMGEHWL